MEWAKFWWSARSISTGVASITVCQADNRIILFAGANAEVRGDGEQLSALLRNSDAVLMQLEIPLQVVLRSQLARA